MMITISEQTARAALVLLIGATSEQAAGKRLIADAQEEIEQALAQQELEQALAKASDESAKMSEK